MADLDDTQAAIDAENQENEEQKVIEELKITQEQCDKLAEYFDIFDKERAGFIESKHLGILLRALGFNPTEKELEDMIKDHDKHGKNLLTKISCLKIMA